MIKALDPAIYLSIFIQDFAINADDAEEVVVMHTSGLGLLRPIGKFDFIANGGLRQPNCRFQPWESHQRAFTFHFQTFKRGAVIIGINENGETCQFGVSMKFDCTPGQYYFITTRNYPFRFEAKKEGKMIETADEIKEEKRIHKEKWDNRKKKVKNYLKTKAGVFVPRAIKKALYNFEDDSDDEEKETGGTQAQQAQRDIDVISRITNTDKWYYFFFNRPGRGKNSDLAPMKPVPGTEGNRTPGIGQTEGAARRGADGMPGEEDN